MDHYLLLDGILQIHMYLVWTYVSSPDILGTEPDYFLTHVEIQTLKTLTQ